MQLAITGARSVTRIVRRVGVPATGRNANSSGLEVALGLAARLGMVRRLLAPKFPASIYVALCLPAFALLPASLCAQGSFTNSASLGATVVGTNLVISYSLATTQGWVTLLVADGVNNFSVNTQQAGPVPVPPSRQGQFLVPLNPMATVKFFKLLVESYPAKLMNFPDLSVVMPPGQISISGSGASRLLRYTHLTFNGGPGPLEILPIYNTAAGIYQGYQRVYSFQTGVWTLRRTSPIAGAFYFHPEHGHFHFPFAIFGLYHQNPDGSIGAPAIISEKTGFCIADSFIYNSSLPGVYAFSYSGGGCANPTSIRGVSIGAVDEYNLLDPGQDIALGNLPNGRYWLRATADPEDLMAESDESNNSTDVEIAITNSAVTEIRIVTPILPQPPVVSLTSPGSGNVFGTVQLAATTGSSGPGFVQFLVDGLPFGGLVAGPPYTLAWDTIPVQNGTHWLAAQTTDSTTERTGTSEVRFVNVNNAATNPPTVQITWPEADLTVSGVVSVSANATTQIGVPTVQFYVDGIPIAPPVAAPPYIVGWNSLTTSDGVHVLTATATNQGGLVGNAVPVSFTVDNSNPPDPLGIDVLVFRDTSGTMTTPAFSTTTASNLIVAFVAYDGPGGGPQTATVSGAGLPWQLVMRSNSQSGTSEIWATKATNVLSSVTVTSQPGTGSYHGSLTVIAFTNALMTGIPARASAPTGPPDIYVPGVTTGNWVFAVGNDWDQAITRTPVSGQVLIHQRVDTQVGDTFWVQATAGPSAGSGAVIIHDTAPTNNQWNYAAVEIVATRP